MTNMASKMQLMYLVACDSARTHWRSLQQGQSLHSEKVRKMLRGRFVHVGKTLTDLQT